MAMKKGRFLSLPVFSVIFVMGFVYYITVFIFLEDWLGLATSPGILNALLVTFFALMGMLSFFVAGLTDPGGVASSFAPETEDPQRNQGVQSRYCDKCCSYKPPRAHHCRVCKRCVLKMDHHCVWINNCVGYWNYKSFIIFVFHAAMGSTYSLVIFMSCIILKDHNFSTVSSKVFYVLSGTLIVILSLSTSTLLGWHIYLLTHNMSTIEYRAAVRAMWLARKSGQKYRHPYDSGVYYNITSILGPSVLKWICPSALGHLKDGTQFPISNDNVIICFTETQRDKGSGLAPWPARLTSSPPRLADFDYSEEAFEKDVDIWQQKVASYWKLLAPMIEPNVLRNIMGSFAAALKEKNVWVMNVVPEDGPNTLKLIYDDRGLIGTLRMTRAKHFPHTLDDLLHSWTVFCGIEKKRCSAEDLLLEMGRIVRPNGFIIIRDTKAAVVEK